jgi:dihydrofolate reductase
MKTISHLVAVSNKLVIGIDNDLPWNLRADLAHFKKYTLNKIIIMGRKTYESIGKPLPNRINYVVSRTLNEVPGAHVFNSLEDAILVAEKENIKMNIDNEIVIIGGGDIFQETVDSINKLIITRVDCDVDGDIYYPDINLEKWNLIKTESFKKDLENDYDFEIEEYARL